MAWRDPTFRVEMFFDFGGLDWINLADFGVGLAGFSYRRGRQDERGTFEPGSATIILSDPDFAIPTDTDVPELPVQIVADWHDGTTQHSNIVVWSGYIADGIQIASGSHITRRLLEITAVDLLGVANNVPMPDSTWAYWIASEDPDNWWPGYSSATTAVAADFVVFDYAADGVHMEAVNGSTFNEEDPIPLGASTPSVELHTGERVGTTAAVGDGGVHAWTVAFAFRMDDISGAGEDCWVLVGRSTSVSGDLRWGVRVDYQTGEVEAEIRDSGDAVIGTAITSIAGRHDDGEPHVVVARFNITVTGNQVIRIHTDLDNSATSGTLSGTPRGSGGFVVTGNTSATRPAFHIADIAYWDADVNPTGITNVSPVLEPFAATPGDGVAVGLWYDQNTSDRLASLIAAAGWSGVTSEIHDESGTDFTWYGVLTKASLGEHFTTLGSVGAAYILRDGTLRIRDVTALADVAHAADYATIQAYLSDANSPSSPSVQYSTPPETRRRRDRIVNQVNLAAADGYPNILSRLRAIDHASIQTWGLRPLDLSTEAVGYDLSTIDLDAFLIPDPPLEVGAIEVRPWGDVEAFKFWLVNLELERVVGFTLSYPDGTEIVDEQPYRVLYEECSWDGGVEVSYRLNLAPA